MKSLTKTSWKAHLNVPGAAIPGHLVKIDDDVGFAICNVWEGGTPKCKKQMKAVAFLISAAPAMYRVIQNALTALDNQEKGARLTVTHAKMAGESHLEKKWNAVADAFAAQTAEARAAIAQAQGKKPTTKKR